MFQKGQYIKVKTKTLEDVFGECVFKILGTGFPCPHCDNKPLHGVKFEMIGGTGPSARKGIVIVDCGVQRWKMFEEGKIQLVDKTVAESMERKSETKKAAKGIDVDY